MFPRFRGGLWSGRPFRRALLWEEGWGEKRCSRGLEVGGRDVRDEPWDELRANGDLVERTATSGHDLRAYWKTTFET